MGIERERESVSSFDDLFPYNFDSLLCSTNNLCIYFLPPLEYCGLVGEPSEADFSKLDNEPHYFYTY